MSAQLVVHADPAATFALLTDPEYVEAVATTTGGTDPEVTSTPTDEGGATVVSARTLPAELPSYAKALVGDTIRITETRTFGPAAADGSRDGTVSVDFAGAPMSAEGTLRLEPGPDGTTVTTVAMTLKASVPFVGGKIEKFAAEEIEKYLGKEQVVAHDRLG
jgi:hypothetical protein